tara:strand:- start:476 stop:703 length:228 start_codon:yes stop_codon:yes gene_type:complete
MSKNIFYSSKLINDDLKIESTPVIVNISKKQKVDINKLLNRVRVKEKYEKKQKFLFLAVSILSLISVGIFLKFFN